MTVGELKKVLNDLPPQYDDFRVEVVDRVESTSRQDRPIFGSLLDERTREFLLAHQEQFEQLKAYAQ